MEREGVPPNAVTYNTAMRACGEGGALHEALALLDEMVERRLQLTVVTYGTAITACQKQGDWKMVRKIGRFAM